MGLVMGPFCPVLACGFFIVTLSSYGYAFFESNDNWDGDFDWKSAMRKINELEKKINVQNERISTLEKRSTESEKTSNVDLQETVQKQNERIHQLEEKISELEGWVVKDDENEPIRTESPGHVSVLKQTTFTQKTNVIRKERLLSQPTTLPTQSVAFFAYFSSHNDASSQHHTLIFDTAITNVGNAYHAHTGTFIAPRSGLYVFIWTVRMNGHNYHTTELVYNNNVINSINLNPGNAIDGTVTGTAVVNVSQGDDVFIRTGASYKGFILSDIYGRSSFAGWLLM